MVFYVHTEIGLGYGYIGYILRADCYVSAAVSRDRFKLDRVIKDAGRASERRINALDASGRAA